MELEQKLQKAFNLSAQYVGIEPPEVKISRDFDIERLIGQDVTALTALFDQQVIDREEFRQILVQGEVLPAANEEKEQTDDVKEEPKREGATSEQVDKLINALIKDGN